ncbi:restriction endonuclease subunit S [Bifidobacterium primatium]|uniref:restriction endonuclease subunit S n=1 Tax=Bifidobacterium primatium TaxID=2045438 RepID=UPI001FB012B3|nr:restriction endonuclease subunit S [Bifidobacterium primatium]
MKLGDIAELSTGPFGSQLHKSDYVDEGIPVVMPQDIDSHRTFNAAANIDESDYSRLGRHALETNDIVFARRGEVDKHAFIRDDDLPALCGTGCLRVRIDGNKANPEFISYYLSGPEPRQYLRAHAVGSNMPNLNTGILSDVVITLPNIDQQKNIVALLHAIDEKIETNGKIIAELEAMARTVYDYWFMQFDFLDEHGNPYRSSGGRMVHNPTLNRDIPEGWEVAIANDLVSIDRGISYSAVELSDEGRPMINLATFNTNSTFKESGLKHFVGETKGSKLLSPFDLVMCVTQQTAIDPTGTTDVIAKTFLVPNVFDEAPTMSMDVVRLIEKRANVRFLLNRMLSRTDYHRYASGYASGTKIKHLDIEGALSFPVTLPTDNALIDKFAEMSTTWAKQVSTRLQESTRLAQLRNRLLPLLMNGQAVIDSANV